MDNIFRTNYNNSWQNISFTDEEEFDEDDDDDDDDDVHDEILNAHMSDNIHLMPDVIKSECEHNGKC